MLRSEEEANDYQRARGDFPEEEGFKPVTPNAKMLRDVLAMHECTHVVTPVSLVGDGEPDFFPPRISCHLWRSSRRSKCTNRQPSGPGSSFGVSRPKAFGGGQTTRSAKLRVGRRRWQMR